MQVLFANEKYLPRVVDDVNDVIFAMLGWYGVRTDFESTRLIVAGTCIKIHCWYIYCQHVNHHGRDIVVAQTINISRTLMQIQHTIIAGTVHCFAKPKYAFGLLIMPMMYYIIEW
jgi:hypothetical protein